MIGAKGANSGVSRMSDTTTGQQPITLDDTRAYLNREFEIEGVDEVTRGDIRRKLEVFGFDCPLHYDEAVARAHGYRTLVAPNAMTALWTMEPYWQPGDPEHYPGEPEKVGPIAGTQIPTPYAKGMNVSSEWEFFEPLYPGDRLKGRWKLVEINEKQTRVGPGVFLTVEATYTKATGEVVGIARNTLLSYNEDPERAAAAKGTGVAAPPPPMQEQVFVLAPGAWDRQLRFEDVRVGEELPPHSLPITYQRIVMAIAQDRMFSPIHHNRDFAREAGLADIIVNTRSYEMLYEMTLRKWMGLDGRLRKLGPFRMTQNSHPGDILTCHGRVVATRVEEDAGIVELDVWDDSHRGEVSKGQATVILPRRG